MQPPKPKIFEEPSSNRAWIVDLVKDVKTGRAIKDLQVPSSPVVFELLNGPCPPRFEQSVIPRIGDGCSSINIRCTGSEEIISLYLPKSEEILGEILHEHGVSPIPDEKRNGYLPVIKRFGGLQLAGLAFSGKSGAVLRALKDEPKTLRKIKGFCQLGDGTLPGQSYLERTEWMFRSRSERIKRIGKRRFTGYFRNQVPENLRLSSVLEFWADRSILSRQWEIGPCSRCNGVFFEPRIDIQKRVLCPACGNRLFLSETIPLGYSLDRHVKRAINEGIIPVVLTGRFLRGMTILSVL
jgi:DNA-directed RNA polymerase subunit RPC12/RpoP